ncbi:hypothetical protein BC628DRAFT_1372546, partial [Trametes gibbosa]
MNLRYIITYIRPTISLVLIFRALQATQTRLALRTRSSEARLGRNIRFRPKATRDNREERKESGFALVRRIHTYQHVGYSVYMGALRM